MFFFFEFTSCPDLKPSSSAKPVFFSFRHRLWLLFTFTTSRAFVMHSTHLYANVPLRPTLTSSLPVTSFTLNSAPPPPYSENIHTNVDSKQDYVQNTRSNGIYDNSVRPIVDSLCCFFAPHHRLRQTIKWTVLGLTVAQLCVFLMCLLRFDRNEHFRLYSKHGPMFTIGIHLCLINALLTAGFQLYAISTHFFPLLCLLTFLQMAYLLLQVTSLLFEHFLFEHLYFVFTLLTLLQSVLLSCFLLVIRRRRRSIEPNQCDLPDARSPSNISSYSSDYLFQQYLNYLHITQLDRSSCFESQLTNNVQPHRLPMPQISNPIEC
jgi:hypothetical protein